MSKVKMSRDIRISLPQFGFPIRMGAIAIGLITMGANIAELSILEANLTRVFGTWTTCRMTEARAFGAGWGRDVKVEVAREESCAVPAGG
jgi:hypothetical protein